jgi:predicted permease
MVNVLSTVIPVFLIIGVGFLVGKLKKKVNLDPIVNMIFYISTPCLVFSALYKSTFQLTDFITIVFSAVMISIILGFIAYAIMKRQKKTGLVLPMSIGNTGYMGYPIALFAWGMGGLSKAVVYDNTAFILLLTLGIALIHKGNHRIKEVIKAAPIYGIILGVLFNTLKIPVTKEILDPIGMIGAITIPAALLVLGYRLTEIKVKEVKIAVLASLFKIILGFLAALLIVNLLGITGTTRNVIIILATMPSAVMSMILTHKYKRDAALAASVVFISTVLSVITIPLVLAFLS